MALAFIFGLLGNIVSFLMYLAPLPTFYRIYKMKSTEGFQSIPYSLALFSATMSLYYGFLKPNGFMLITINTIGCSVEATYLTIYMIYATNGAMICTAKLLSLLNFLVAGLILSLTYFLSKGPKRITIVGCICAVASTCVYAAPLGIMRKVIKTKSVEFMPLPLSFFLTLCGIVWFFYGLLMRDYNIASSNMLGLFLGICQMRLYAIYKKEKQPTLPEHRLQELTMVDDKPSNPAEAPANQTFDPIKSESITLEKEDANAKPSEINESIV